jgi:CubicO group peptidase (beta-lactamase class C family)
LNNKVQILTLTGFLSLAGLSVQCTSGQVHTEPSEIAGVWEGHLNVLGQQVRLVYKISVNEDNSLSVLYDSPDYPLFDVPVSDAKLKGDRVFMSVGSFPAVFEGKIGDGIITGRYSGGGMWLPLNLTRQSADPRFLLDYMVPRLDAAGEQLFAYSYTPPEQSGDGWDVADASDAGLDTRYIDSLIRRILAGDFPNLHSVLLIKDGKLLVEEYFYSFHRNKTHQIASVSKVIPAAAIGIALERGLIHDIHTPLSHFFPEYNNLFSAGEKSSLTLHHLLTMTTGLQWDEHATDYLDPRNDFAVMKSSPDPLGNLFERPLAYRPGERFIYNSGCVIALEEILQRVTKTHHLAFVQNELFTPLGISNYRFDDGYQMTPRDMAKLGLLFQSGGGYKGERILAAAWVDSSLQRDTRRKYFNHWWPVVHFTDRIPVHGLVAGGWGGQSITIIPDMNAIIVMTAANQMQPVDYDISISEYLLPAILTPEYLSKHAEISDNRITEAKNIEWEMRWDTEMGCLKGSARSLGIYLSDAMLYGATGIGFLINIDERAEAKSMAVMNKQRVYELCRNIGFSVETVWSHKSSPNFSETQKLVWDRVRSEINSGNACYGFHLGSPIRYLISGYDDRGYYYKGWDAEKGKGPVYWDDLGQTDIGLLGMHFVRPVKATTTLKEIVKNAFEFVVEFSKNPNKWVPGDCKAGPEGYARWIYLIDSGTEDGYGVSYNAAQFSEARKFAVEFLEEARAGLGEEFTPLFDEALLHYRAAARNLEMMSDLFPHNISSADLSMNLKDPMKRQAAGQYLRAAKDAEIEGLKALSAIIEKL